MNNERKYLHYYIWIHGWNACIGIKVMVLHVQVAYSTPNIFNFKSQGGFQGGTIK